MGQLLDRGGGDRCCGIAARAAAGHNAAAETALARMEAAYKTFPALHIKVRWSAKYSGGMSAKIFLTRTRLAGVKDGAADKFYLSAASKRDGERSRYMVVSDGTTLTYWRSSTNSLIQKNTPATLSGVARPLPDPSSASPPTTPGKRKHRRVGRAG